MVFRSGHYDTGLIEARGDALIPAESPHMTVAAALILLDAQRTDSPWQRGDAFRVNLAHEQRLRMRRRGDAIAVGVAHDAAGYRITLDDRAFAATAVSIDATAASTRSSTTSRSAAATCATATTCT